MEAGEIDIIQTGISNFKSQAPKSREQIPLNTHTHTHTHTRPRRSHPLERKMKVNSLSCVQLLATPWTVAYQAPPSMEFSSQEYWSRLHLQGIFLTQGWPPGVPHCRQTLYYPSHQESPLERSRNIRFS